MFVLPALTTIISLAFAAQLLDQYRERRRPHQLAWGIALACYALASATEAMAASQGWGEAGYKTFYLFGGVLLVPLLSLGTVELLATRPGRLGYRAFVALVAVVGIVAVVFAPLHVGHLATHEAPSNCAMWCKSEQGYGLANGLSALAAAVGNALGTVVLLGGAAWSAYRAYRASLPREYTAGNALIAAGSLVVAGASTLTRLGSYQFFYAGQLLGVGLIFAGFLVIGSAAHARAGQVPA